MSKKLNNLTKAQLITTVNELLVELSNEQGENLRREKRILDLEQQVEALKNQIVTMGCELQAAESGASGEGIFTFGRLLKLHGLMTELKYFGALFTSGKIKVNNDHDKYFIVQGGKNYEADFTLLKKVLEGKGEKVYLQTDLNGVRLNIVK